MSNLILLLSLVLPVASLLAVGKIFRRHRSGKTATAVSLGIDLLLLVAVVSTVFAAGEMYFRFLVDTTDSFSMSLVSRRWYDRHFRKNAAGFRDDVEYAPGLTPGRHRVTFFGDSFTAGHGLDNVEDRFTNLLRRRHPEWEVQTLAQPGWETGGVLDGLRDARRHGFELQTVVLVYSMNDIADLIPEWRETYASLSRDFAPTNPLTRHSYFANSLFFRFEARRHPDFLDYFRLVENAYGGRYWDQQTARLAELQHLVENRGGSLAVVTFPFLHDLGTGYPYRDAHARLQAFWAARGVPHLDLLPALEKAAAEGTLTVNAYDAHPNVRANRVVAETLDPFLVAAVAGPPRPGDGAPAARLAPP